MQGNWKVIEQLWFAIECNSRVLEVIILFIFSIGELIISPTVSSEVVNRLYLLLMKQSAHIFPPGHTSAPGLKLEFMVKNCITHDSVQIIPPIRESKQEAKRGQRFLQLRPLPCSTTNYVNESSYSLNIYNQQFFSIRF